MKHSSNTIGPAVYAIFFHSRATALSSDSITFSVSLLRIVLVE